jgi:plasmid stability protein
VIGSPPSANGTITRGGKGRALEQEPREILTEAAKPSRAEARAELDRCRAMTPDTHRTPAEDIIREVRDEE